MTHTSSPKHSFKEFLDGRILLGRWRPANLGDRFSPVQVRRALFEIERQFGGLAPRQPKQYDLEQVYQRVRSVWSAEQTLADLNQRELEMLPWVLFYPRDLSSKWLGQDKGLVEHYGQLLLERRRTRSVRVLLREVLAAWPEEIPTFNALLSLLKRLLGLSDDIRLKHWRERCLKYRLLERNGPSSIASAWFNSGKSVTDFLEEVGLSPGLENSVFLRNASKDWANRLMENAESGNTQDLLHALSWLEGEDRLRFEELRVSIAKSLLGPFTDHSPEADTQDILRKFFLRCYDDPRIPRRGGWSEVPERIKHVMCRWLVRLAIDDFFRLLDRTALDRHWRYRKVFWKAYLKEDAIEDAWIILGPDAARLARASFEHGDQATAKLLPGYPVQANHSVLLMRLHSVTIAEWSHNGTCRFWLDGNPDAPGMYRPKYSQVELTKDPDFEQRHHGAEKGRWQTSMAAWIRDNTGIHIHSYKLMPPRRNR